MKEIIFALAFVVILLLCTAAGYWFGRTISRDADKAKEEARQARECVVQSRAEEDEKFRASRAEADCKYMVEIARKNERKKVLDEVETERKKIYELCECLKETCERLKYEKEEAERAVISKMAKEALENGEKHALAVKKCEGLKAPVTEPDCKAASGAAGPAQRMPGESYGEPLEEINGVMQAIAEYAAQPVEYRR
ncbi:MAG: hypothetical protein EOM69_05550 [Clostridia bacterium]|nr:hypothetical protein [Clostridia bacterium]